MIPKVDDKKRCPKCGQYKPLDEFNSDASRGDGKMVYCKECKRAYSEIHYKTHHEEILERGKEYNHRPEVKKRKQLYERQPEVRKRRREQDRRPARQQRKRELKQTPEAKAKRREYDKIHNQLPEVKKAHRNQMRQYTIDHPEWAIVQRGKQRAKKKGVPFGLKPEDIVIPAECPILGIELKIGAEEKTGQSPSLDEIIPGLGYVVENFAIISDRANTIKNSGTSEEHRKIADWMKNRTSGKIEITGSHKASTSKERRVVNSARQRAKGKGIFFDLRLEDLEFPERCPIFDVPFESGTRHSHDNAPSLDRIDATKGYTLDNVAIICHRANFIKSDGTAEEHLKIADWIDQKTLPQNTKTVI